MARYELLLISRNFQRPRQFLLNMNGRLSGAELADLLHSAFPEQRWFSGTEPLESLGVCSSARCLILRDLPQAQSEGEFVASTKLYVLHGRDAGAWIPLTHGEHIVGRSAPLWLEDPLLSRSHAVLSVTARELHLVAASGKKIFDADDNGHDSMDLSIGSIFRLGNTVFSVGDPVSEDFSQSVSVADLEVQVPDKPDASRLITVILAAIVPLLTGLLLAFLMHSMLFLIISGVSALMAVVPASQMVSERRCWRRTMREQRTFAIQARAKYAAPLGHVLLAGLEGAALAVAPRQVPPLVWGEGLWYPQTSDGARDKKPRKAKLRLTRPKTDAPCPGPVFVQPAAGIWQIVAEQDSSTAEILANVLSRFIPQINAGVLKLNIDPSICCLPASLLLMKNVQVSRMNEASDPPRFSRESTELKSLYVTAQRPRALPETLVIALFPVLCDQTDNWIAPDTLSADLPDKRFVLERLHRLSPKRLDRVIQQFLDRQMLATTAMVGQDTKNNVGFRTRIGLDADGQEVELDLDDDGPHMLICGTTGSGKSEALRRIISDLVDQYAPEQLGLVLVDFKGGAGLGVFEHLPHVQLFASDLDEAAAQRTVEQLEHEVQRRETILSDNGCSDLAEYENLVDAPQPLPRLLVVIDEFRVFIETLPLAGPKIDRLAAVGRALGIHLVLSTQRPAGALSGQTRANLNTIVALRVNDPSESVELVGSTAATALDRPGLAIIKSSSRPTQTIQFHLAVEPALEGELLERNRETMQLSPTSTITRTQDAREAEPLRTHVASLIQRWSEYPKPHSGFAPALPLPGAPWNAPSLWEGSGTGSLYCGVRDDLKGGALKALTVGTESKRSLLICGLPDSGAKEVFTGLARTSRRILCFGPSDVIANEARKELKTVSGQDLYQLFDALDFLESPANKSDLIILVHSIAQLQSELHPQHFQRLDDVLGALLRRADAHSPLIVCSVDRDQNALKSTGLFTTQWYFSLNATDSLKMMWPKLPACSALPGRGVEVTSEHPPQVFQLTNVYETEVERHPWQNTSHTDADHEDSLSNGQRLLGYLPFTGQQLLLPEQSRMIVIHPNQADRLTMSRVLAQRWEAALLEGIEELVDFAQSRNVREAVGPKLICANVFSSADARLSPALEQLRLAGVRIVLFVPPSTRLTYDLGLSAISIDDRELLVVESEHIQDMQPSTWPPLQRKNVRPIPDYWRAIIARNGQPRMIHIPLVA